MQRANPQSSQIPEFTAVEEELADVIIRIMDYAIAKKLNIAEALTAKVSSNSEREFMYGQKNFELLKKLL